MKTIQKFSLLLALLSILTLGCEKEEVGPDGTPAEPGTFKAYMTDSPGDFQSLDVEILKVDAYIEGTGWVTLSDSARVIDVLSLTNGVQTEIAATADMEAHAGLYSKLKIVFGDRHRLTLNAAAAAGLGGIVSNGLVFLDLGFEGSHEVIVEINERINSRNGAEILLDFDVAQSVYQEANEFVLKPTIRLMENVTTGVRGHVNGTASAAVTLTGEGNTYSTYINAQGDFLIRGMEEGVYDMLITAGQAADDAQAPAPRVIEGIVVVTGEISGAGTVSF